MAETWRYPVGYSDHTPGIAVSLGAVALGAHVIEKHFTLDRGLPGPDHRASLERAELERLVVGIRAVEASLGSGEKRPAESEAEIRAVARRSLVAAVDIPAGATIAADMLACKRPGTGLPPSALASVVGRRVRIDIARDDLIETEMFE